MSPLNDTAKRAPAWLVAVALLFLAAACSRSVGISTTWDTLFDFDPVRTYDWAAKEPETGDDLPFDALDAAIKRTVESELSQRGFTRSSSNPALRLTYYLGDEEVTGITDPAYYGPGWAAWWGQGWFSTAGVNASQYDATTLTIDALSSDPSIGMVFRGIARGKFTSAMSTDQMQRAVESAVREILENFPPEPDE